MARAKNRDQHFQAPAPTLHSFQALRYSRSSTEPKLTCLERSASEETLLNIIITTSLKLSFSQPNITWFSTFPFVQTEVASWYNSQGEFFFFKRGGISHIKVISALMWVLKLGSTINSGWRGDQFGEALTPTAGQLCGHTLPKTLPSYSHPCCLARASLAEGDGSGHGMQGKGEGWCWLWMLNKQFFLTTIPGTCSPHVMAHDDLVSPKHDQAISAAVSLHLNSNGGSLSICLLLKSKRSIGLCIFSLMNSLFPTFFFPL